jgi:hypothetical protein
MDYRNLNYEANLDSGAELYCNPDGNIDEKCEDYKQFNHGSLDSDDLWKQLSYTNLGDIFR